MEVIGLGVAGTGVNTTVLKNYMHGVNIGVNMSINSNANTYIGVNNIEAYVDGVKLSYNDPVSSLQVENNEITVGATTDAISNACILINESGKGPKPTNVGYERINNNILHANIAAYGISATGTDSTETYENTIYLNQPDYNISGINLNSGINNLIAKDTVVGVGAGQGSTGLFPQGLTVTGSTSSLIQCNYFTDLKVGTGFYSNCNPTQFIHNHFNNHDVGLYYSSTGITNPQYYHCNIWTGNYINWKARNDNFPFSAYFVNTIPADMDPLIPNNPLQVTPGNGWFTETQGSGAIMDLCQNPGVNNMAYSTASGLNQVDSTIANQGIGYQEYVEELQWKDGRYLLNYLTNNDSLVNGNNVMEHFVDSVQNLSVGIYHNLERMKNNLGNLSPVTVSYIHGMDINLTVIRESIRDLDSIAKLTGNETELAVINHQIENLRNQESVLMVQKRQALTGMATLSDSTVNIIITENGYMPSCRIYEQNEKTLNEIYLNTIAKGKIRFSQEQKQSLYDIAIQCSLCGGKAVDLARSMYCMIKDTLFNDWEQCIKMGIVKSSKIADNLILERNYHLYPNPALNEISLSWTKNTNDFGKIEIYNLLGELVIKKEINLVLGTTILDLSGLKDGIYTAMVIDACRKVVIGKIVKIK